MEESSGFVWDAGNKDPPDEKTQRELDSLRTSMYLTVSNICQTEQERLGVTFSKKSILLLTEILMEYCTIHARDIELFAKHRRNPPNIQPADVLLCARHSRSIQHQLSSFLPLQGATKKSKLTVAETVSDNSYVNLDDDFE